MSAPLSSSPEELLPLLEEAGAAAEIEVSALAPAPAFDEDDEVAGDDERDKEEVLLSSPGADRSK